MIIKYERRFLKDVKKLDGHISQQIRVFLQQFSQ